MEPIREKLEKLFPGKVRIPESTSDIPASGYMVYVLTYKGKPIVTGHGRKNRAVVILDNTEHYSNGHIKALFVRLYQLYGKGSFERFIIPCSDKGDAQSVEKILHREIGGNHRSLPDYIRIRLFDGIPEKSVARLVLEIALRSSFDGLADLKKWRSDGLLDDDVWDVIQGKLNL